MLMDFIKKASIEEASLQIQGSNRQTFGLDDVGNLIITYQNIGGSVLNWDKKRDQTSVIGSRPFITNTYTRKRLLNPKGSAKYLSSQGQPSAVFVNGLHAFDLWSSDWLVITEGEKKAFVGCANNIPSVGIQGIHQAVNTHKDSAGNKRPELTEMMQETIAAMPNLKTVILLFDGDCLEGSTSRRRSFASAVVNFQEATKTLEKAVYFAHIATNLPKGLDDLLIEKESDYEVLFDSLESLAPSEYFEFIQLPAKLRTINAYFQNALSDNEHPQFLQEITRAYHGGQKEEAELLGKILRPVFRFNATRDRWMKYVSGKWDNNEKHSHSILFDICDSLKEMYKKAERFLVTGNDPKEIEKSQNRFNAHMTRISSSGYLSGLERLLRGRNICSELDLDVNPYVLNCQNGELNLQSMEFTPHDPESSLSLQCATNYNPEAKLPEKFLKFIAFISSATYDMREDNADTLSDDELDFMEFFQIWAGLCLSGLTSWQAFIYAYGQGGNGKTTFSQTIAELLGTYAGTLDTSAIMASNRNNTDDYKIAEIRGKRLIIGTEVSKNELMNEARVKALTGGDSITARPIYGSPITFEGKAKYYFFGNHKLQIRGQDEGIWRRVHLVEMLRQIPKTASLEDVLAEFAGEREGILNWAIEGFQKFLANGKDIKKPKIISRATDSYRRDSDTLADFIEEEIYEHAEEFTYLDDMFQCYIKFCEKRNEPATFKTIRSFKSALVSRSFDVNKGGAKNKNRVNGWALTMNKVQNQDFWSAN